ncbi:MAG: hypothetical protein JNJ57_04540 [Saprospiraceae bacterium]|nr:hypothetical protein [Saprospiraceae bacterium]
MKHLSVILFAAIVQISFAQTEPKFNLGFEKQTDPNALSDGWFQWGQYLPTIDSDAHAGSRAGKVASGKASGNFGCITYRIPANYKGASIKLEGYMKIKDVKNGFAGLLLRIDGEGTSLAFDNMQEAGINGTRDWEKYEITLDYPENAEIIFAAGIMVGEGEAWFDDLKISIDGQDIQELKETPLPTVPAENDHAFDTGSGILFPKLTPELSANLELLGKVWGFLKYHHPAIAKGQYNWDYELFRFLPTYFEVKNNKQRDQKLLDWINGLGEVAVCSSCKPVDKQAVIRPDHAWMNDKSIGADLRKKLAFIYQNRHQGKHYYIRMVAQVGNPEFRHESPYSKMPYPDEGFRLLALYKYWNMIHYFFPYKHLCDKNWNQVLSAHIPSFLNASNELEYEMAAVKIISDAQDTHANLWGGGDRIAEATGQYFPPVAVRFVENQLTVTDYYNPELKTSAGLEIGDVITKINGKKTEEIVQSKSYYPASNQPTRLRDVAEDILRSSEPKVDISYVHEGKEKNATLKLYTRDSLNYYRWYREPAGPCFKMLEGNIGYVTLANIRLEDIPVFMDSFQNTKGLIIDIRNYPSNFVVFGLGGYFVDEPEPFVKFTQGNTDHPGEFIFGEPLAVYPAEGYYEGKVVVLVNELSQSQAEYTAMAFRAGHNTTIIGSTTAGADGNISSIQLPGGLRTAISGIGVHYPEGKETQRVGIVPDIVVRPTLKGIREGRDELLEKALEVINK